MAAPRKTTAAKKVEPVNGASDEVPHDENTEPFEDQIVVAPTEQELVVGRGFDSEALKTFVEDPTITEIRVDGLKVNEAEDVEPKPAASTKKGKGKGTTFWLADPSLELRIKKPGTRRYLQFIGGKITVDNAEDEKLVRDTGVAYEDDGWRENKASEPHPVSGYYPGSAAAYMAHQKLIPQG